MKESNYFSRIRSISNYNSYKVIIFHIFINQNKDK